MASTPDSSDGFADRRPNRRAPPLPTRKRRTLFAGSPVYPVLDASVFGGRDPGPVLRALGGLGIGIAQLRGKTMRTGDFLAWVSAGVRGAAGTGIRVLVNDRADVALLAGADGVHLGQDDLSAGAVRRHLGPAAVIGLSTHTREEVQAARGEPVDYLAIGPVFATGTKTDTAPVVSLSGVREARRGYDGPLVAIGGIDAHRIGSVLDAGADAVAVISAVSGSSPREVAGRTQVLLAAVEAATARRLP